MNARNGPLSPVSFDSNSDWSPLSKYQNLPGNDNGPYPPSKGNLITPPASGHTSADTTHTDGGMSKLAQRLPSNGNPSPPSSIARSSGMSGSMDSRKQFLMEDALAEHYNVLKRYLAPYLPEQRGPHKQARDKLLRLTTVQFEELSTDVYDELQRREGEKRSGGRGAPGNNVPQYLLPKSNFHYKRNQAREKLSTLPSDRFRQLATDVFFELGRRYPRFTGGRPASPAGSMVSNRGPPPNRPRPPNGYGGPPPPPFRAPQRGTSLASNGPGPNPLDDKPLPKTFQSNTIVPNKGTMVEDEDDQMGDDMDDLINGTGTMRSRRTTDKSFGSSDKMVAEQQEQIAQLEQKIDDLSSQLRDKDRELGGLRESSKAKEASAGSEKAEWSRLQDDLEGRLSDAQNLNQNLQGEIDRIRRDNADTERNMRRQLEDAREEAGRAATDPDMARQYEALQNELAEQQRLTDEVKREALQYLTEMRGMSTNSAQSFDREEQLVEQVAQLERELKDWKARYARSKTQIRSLRASSVGLGAPLPDVAGTTQDSSLTDPNGLVKDTNLTKFQISIDELLQTARLPQAEAVLEPMKAVVTNVRNITAGIEDVRGSTPTDSDLDSANPLKQQSKLKSVVSATANNLITASKNHAAANGLSPVSLIDAAASHLTTAVIELVKVVKIRPTPADELDEEDAAMPAPLSAGGMRKGYGGLANGMARRTHSSQLSRSSINSLGYSATSSPRRGEVVSSRTSEESPGLLSAGANRSPPINIGLGVNGIPEDVGAELDEYKTYLEDQTALLVQNIQPLVSTIRSGARNDAAVERYVEEISKAIVDIGEKTREAIQATENDALERHGPPVIEVLEECRRGLVAKGGRGEMQGMPPIAFKIARATKELVLRVDRIESGELTADMACPLEM